MKVSVFSESVRALVDYRSGGYCEVCSVPCSGAGQYHHRRARGMGGSRDPRSGSASNCLFLCLPDHEWVERFGRDVARDKGWLVRQGVDPAQVPVWRFDRWVLLTDTGDLLEVEAA